MEPILLDSGIQIFEDGPGLERTFNKWKAEAESKGELVIADLKSDEGMVKLPGGSTRILYRIERA